MEGVALAIPLYYNGVNAGKGVVRAIEARGFEGQIEFRNGFDLIDEIT